MSYDYNRTKVAAPFTGMAPRWKPLGRLEKGGHRLFKDEASGYVAIADNSGPTPDRTEDGILWLDERQELTIKEP